MLPGDTTVAFGVADIVVVVCYFAFVLIVGIWVSPLGLLCLRWRAFDPPWGLQRASSAHTVIPRPVEWVCGVTLIFL